MLFTRQESCKTIGVYEGKDLKILIHSATDIVKGNGLEILDTGQWSLYCFTKNGSLYMVKSDRANQSIRNDRMDSGDVEIFSDLLGQGEKDSGIHLNVSTQPVYILSEFDLIKKYLDPVGLCVSSRYLVVVTEEATSYTVHLLGKQKAGSCLDERIAKLGKNTYPGDESQAHDTVLVKVVTSPCLDECGTSSPYDLSIDTTLFKQLFGENAALLNSPVIFIVLATSVYFLPMSSFVHSGKEDSSSTGLENVCQTDNWNVLCQMSSNVEDIVVLNRASNGDERVSTSLCICGCDGQLMTFGHSRESPEYIVSELFIVAPVQRVFAFHNRLYYTSLHQLYESTLKFNSGLKGLSINKKMQVSQTKLLSAKYVSNIHAAYSDGYTDSQDSPCYLPCTQSNGDLVLIDTSAWKDNDVASMVKENGSLKDILASIDDIDKRRNELKDSCNIQERTLQQLSIASYLIAFYDSQKRVGLTYGGILADKEKLSMSSNVPFSVTVRPNTPRDPESDTTELDVEISNQMPVGFSNDWFVTASLNTLGDDSHSVSSTKNIANNWKQKESIILTLIVPFIEILTGCRLVVKALLVKDSHLLKDHPVKQNEDKSCISFPLFEKYIDILDCLMPPRTAILQKCTGTLYTRIKKQAVERSFNLKKDSVKTGFEGLNVHSRNRVKLCIPVPNKNDSKNEASLVLLGDLLGKSASEMMGIQPSDCHMVTPTGEDVHLSILCVTEDRSNTNEDEGVAQETFDVIVRSTPNITAAVHMAIKRRETNFMKALGGYSIEEIRTDSARKAIQTSQVTANEISVHMKDKETLMAAFQKIRNINL